ncbi:hypothetical protein FRC08_001370 [Ceratobasidium sp. 394]|nr:hypothetical protein FRC08_001370 [Ceratobasidium sp. 394]
MRNWYFNPPARNQKVDRVSFGTCHKTFHERCLPDYTRTPLIDAPSIANELSVGRVFIKDESSRLGLPAFKILGASWAIFHVLCERFSFDPSTATLDLLRNQCVGKQVSLWAATDGNHGRAVARMAILLGVKACIVVPKAASLRSRSFIASEGAEVVQVEGDYDEAVNTAEKLCIKGSSEAILTQDTAWEGYTSIPMQIVLGYTTMFAEIDEQLLSQGLVLPSVVVIPVGVGSLAHAAVLHYRSRDYPSPPAILTVEPDVAACLFASLTAGKPTTIPTGETIMAGLNCGTVSSLAWPDLSASIDAATTVSDEEVDQAVRDLALLGVSSGPCGAATVAALHSIVKGDDASERRNSLGLNREAIVVVISSESSEVYLEGDLVV